MNNFTEITTNDQDFGNVFGLYISTSKKNSYLLFKSKNNNDTSKESVSGYLNLMSSLVSDYFSGNYTRIPLKTILAISSVLLYIIKPKKKLEKAPVIKQIKNISLILQVMWALQTDLLKYKTWKDQQIINEVN
jgi:hypothetical protein